MTQPIRLDRRRFVQMLGGTSLLGAVGTGLDWVVSMDASPNTAKLAYIGAKHEIRVFSIAANGRWVEQQSITSANPVAMAIANRDLYVANGVSEYDKLPRGSVEAFAIDAATGRLNFKNRVPLSLSGILPRDLAVAPGGRSIVVAVHGGGAYNVLPRLDDGSLGRVLAILKETGSGPHASQASAHPSAIMFDRMGRLLAADQGSDTLSVITFRDGELAAFHRCAVAAGSGPCSMVLHPGGKRLYVAYALNGSVSSFGYDATAGKILEEQQTVATRFAGETAALAMHPSGRMLYSAHGSRLQSWKIASDASLEAVAPADAIQANRLHVTADGKSLLALTGDAVLRMTIDATTNMPSMPATVASVSGPISIATL